jgi:hypothetical protein
MRVLRQISVYSLQALCLLAVTKAWNWLWILAVKLFEHWALGVADDQIAAFIVARGPTVTALFDWAPPLLLAGCSLWIFERFYLRQSLLSRPQTGSHSLAEIAGMRHPKDSWIKTWGRKVFPPKMMPIHEAAWRLHDALQGTKLEQFVEKHFGDVETMTNILGMYIWETNIPIFGKALHQRN